MKNPISLARLVKEKSPHVFLVGEGAEAAEAEAQGQFSVALDRLYMLVLEHPGSAELRDSHSPFMAYVPIGSVERGRDRSGCARAGSSCSSTPWSGP